MATDYDAPRKNEEDQSEESIEELKARRHDKNSGKVDEDEAEAAESFELPGADLSHEELAVEVKPKQEDEFTCMSCFLVHHRSQLADEKKHDLQGLRLSAVTERDVRTTPHRPRPARARPPGPAAGRAVSVSGPARPPAGRAAGGRSTWRSSRRPGAARASGPARRAAPLTTAQATASPMSTSGSAGFSGGFLPVAAFQVVSRAFCATAAAPSAAPARTTVQIFELSSAMSRTVPSAARGRHPGAQPTGERAARGQLLGAPGADQPVRRGVGRVGDLHPDRALEVGPEHQVRPGVGLRAGRPPGLLGVERPRPRRGAGLDVRAPGPAARRRRR